ncbi:type II secretion system minor pseudopilin GspK [Legionella genomosp. 1]|uniref:type II secretion system minor pseudopilin GspK n=1 Tax=Legionella genomosp. 1 TaxID=1093625 RepID=UPI00105505AB|nr:type II secretion system minor pseudopilin GspK [Legionella genomosp. 1]
MQKLSDSSMQVTHGKSSPLNRGSALISALFIMTLVAIAATAMSSRLQLDIYHTRIAIQSDDLYLASQAVSFWAMGELSNKSRLFLSSDPNGKLMDFPAKMQGLYPNIRIQGGLYDLQGRFNLNNVADKRYNLLFFHLLKQVLPKLKRPQRLAIADAIFQWISPYQPGRGQDQFVSYYIKQKPPYYPSQQFMTSVTELRLIKGVDANTYQALEPYTISLPEITTINLNTASRPVLAALGNSLDPGQVDQIIEARGQKGFSDLKKITKLLRKFNIRAELITLESEFFLSIANVSSEDLNMVSYTIFKRQKTKDGKLTINLISESINSL